MTFKCDILDFLAGSINLVWFGRLFGENNGSRLCPRSLAFLLGVTLVANSLIFFLFYLICIRLSFYRFDSHNFSPESAFRLKEFCYMALPVQVRTSHCG